MLEKYEKWMSRFFTALGSMFFIILVLMTFVQVITRYVVNISFPWAEEFLRFCYTYMILFGLLTTTQIQVPLLRHFISQKIHYGWLLSSCLYVIMLFTLWILLQGGLKIYSMNMNSYYSAFKISKSWVYVPFVICIVLESIRIILALIHCAKSKALGEL
ncbi:TRAP transporter small permease [Lonepinella sp. BR2930]|uniref:TRAP transporter small permease n=1 Tax=Lonepinella sp. BR2930 TaxID=3434554 RepID=UPI003F6E1100